MRGLLWRRVSISSGVFVPGEGGIRWRIAGLRDICKLCRLEGSVCVEVVVFDCLGL